MIKTLTRHGNSYALVIDKPIMELLDITASTPIEIATDGKALVVSPVQDARRRKKFQAALAKANRKYPKMLRRLAD